MFNSYRASVWDDEKVLEAISGESESQPVMSDYIVHGILQARILEWEVILFYRESSQGLNPDLPHFCKSVRRINLWNYKVTLT